MNAVQLAEIRPALQEAAAGAPDMCATFQAEGNEKLWIQFMDQTINASYPLHDEPEEKIRRLELPPLPMKLIGWEPGLYATFELAEFNIEPVADWIDAYFVRVLGCTEGEYHLDVTCERL